MAFIGLLFAVNTVVFPVALALLSVIAVMEVQKTIGLKNKYIRALNLIVAALIPFFVHFDLDLKLIPAITFYCIFVFIFMLIEYENTKFEQAVMSIFISLAVPYAFSMMLLFRDVGKHFPGKYTAADGIFFLILSIFCSWLTDIFAYFAGSFLGKHKLCPKISPKKTVEGAIGGILGALLLNLALLFVFNKFFFETSIISYAAIIPISILLSVVSICGDLTASVLKRNYGVKDFGGILPGHGGIMDRFDSCFFVMPVLYSVIVALN